MQTPISRESSDITIKMQGSEMYSGLDGLRIENVATDDDFFDGFT